MRYQRDNPTYAAFRERRRLRESSKPQIPQRAMDSNHLGHAVRAEPGPTPARSSATASAGHIRGISRERRRLDDPCPLTRCGILRLAPPGYEGLVVSLRPAEGLHSARASRSCDFEGIALHLRHSACGGGFQGSKSSDRCRDFRPSARLQKISA